jgi:glycosyltransferase involved in cell wall biosynthesis
LIHAHFLYPTGFVALELKKIFNKKIVLTPHGGDIYSWPYERQANKTIARSVLKGSDKITSLSSVIDKNIEKLLPSALEKTCHITNFTNTNKFKIMDRVACRERLSIPANKKVVLNVANITDGKGHLDLLEAFSGLKNKADYSLYIIGQGELAEVVSEQIINLGLEGNVHMVGPIANNELPSWYNASDIMVFPSYFESFGIVQIEAMACGIPVVAYSNEGSKNIITNDKLGTLSPIGNIKDLSRNIEKAFSTRWFKEVIREHVTKNYSEESAKHLLLRAYDDIITHE